MCYRELKTHSILGKMSFILVFFTRIKAQTSQFRSTSDIKFTAIESNRYSCQQEYLQLAINDKNINNKFPHYSFVKIINK